MDETDACSVRCAGCGLRHTWWEKEPTEPECKPDSKLVRVWLSAPGMMVSYQQYADSPQRRFNQSSLAPWWNATILMEQKKRGCSECEIEEGHKETCSIYKKLAEKQGWVAK
jgi:hypothetical protein